MFYLLSWFFTGILVSLLADVFVSHNDKVKVTFWFSETEIKKVNGKIEFHPKEIYELGFAQFVIVEMCLLILINRIFAIALWPLNLSLSLLTRSLVN